MRHYPHCPNQNCKNHSDPPNNAGWYKKAGFYWTHVNGKKPRFACKECGKTFTSRTFSIDYFAKKKIDYDELIRQQKAACGFNEMARRFHCNSETIHNRLRRLARHLKQESIA